MNGETPIRIFVSYAHEDQGWRNALFRRSLYGPEGYVCPWTDAMIEPGTAWNDSILRELEAASVAILLVSRHFLKSDYISGTELPAVLKRRTAEGLKLLWIPIGALEEGAPSELASIQAAWSLAQPLSDTPDGDPAVVERIAGEVRASLEAAIDPVGVSLMHSLGTRFDPFVRIGRTDCMALYKTRDRMLNRPVVIKALTDDRQREVFVRNAGDAAVVADEPSFCNLYEASLTERWPFCVMQYVDGTNLRRWIQDDARRPLDKITRILAKIARALVGVHRLRSNYGNLKPSNVMLSKRDEPFILPLGRRVDECRGTKALDELQRRNPDAEEIAYLLPEQFDMDIDTVSGDLSDQYMLGLLAYELVTGTLPPTLGPGVPGPDSLKLIRSRGADAFQTLRPVTELRPDCPDVLAGIIQRMTRTAPDERYPSLEALLIEVRSQQDVTLARVRESYRRCLDNQTVGGRFFAAVYDRFFALRPDARAMFPNFGERQFTMLEKAVVDLFAFYEQERTSEPEEPNVLSQVAQSHDRHNYKVGMDFYAPFRDALIETACGKPTAPNSACDPNCRRDASAQRRIRRAWEDVLRPGVAYMMGKF